MVRKRLVCFMLVLFEFLSIAQITNIVVNAESITFEQFNYRLSQLQTQYPEGSSVTKIYNSSYGGSSCYRDLAGHSSWQCFAWGSKVFDTLWNKSIGSATTHSNVNNICIGDYVRYRSTSEYDHSIVITKISGNDIWYTDGNGKGTNLIRYNVHTTKSNLQTLINKTLTSGGTGFIKHCSDNSLGAGNIHTHSYTNYRWFYAAHPHYNAYQCSCGDIQPRTSETNFYIECPECTKHTLFVNPNGGTWNGYDKTQAITKSYGNTVDVPLPKREGYTFAGWTMASFGGTRFNESTDLSNNGIGVYNNALNNTVVHEYINKPDDCPTDASKILKITKNAGTSYPNLGGFSQCHSTAANKVYYQVIVAKIPKGYTINHHTNACGDNPTFTWLTSQEGTGEWETYIHKTVCGSSGTFHNAGIGFYSIAGQDATEDNPVTWYVGYTNIFDGSNNAEDGTGQYMPYGKPLFNDTLMNDTNSMKVYNNLGNGNVSFETIQKSEDLFLSANQVLKITTNGEASPSLGGFYQSPVLSAANKVYYQVVIAKIPKGYTINHGSNACGDNPIFTWITSQEGTGEWETYIHKTICGSNGTFHNAAIGYIYIDGPVATLKTPVTWYVGYSNVFDATGINQYIDQYKFLSGNDMLTATWKSNSSIEPVKEATFNNNTYELYEGNYSWSDAKKICEDKGGHLVTITDADEDNIIKELISGARSSEYWLGATNEQDESVWKWVTGETFDYNNWESGEPNNGNGQFSERYAQIYSKTGNWNDGKDYLITNSRGFICEYENSKNIPLVVTLSTSKTGDEKRLIESTIKNVSINDVSGQAYIAVHDANGKLKSIICEPVNISSKNSTEISKEVSVKEDDIIKIFVWNNNILPLSKVESVSANTTVSDWILKSDVPDNATIVETKFTYTETSYQESSSSEIIGWEKYDSYWNTVSTNSFNYASFPGGFNTGHTYYNNLNWSALEGYETETQKRVVNNSHVGYIYWHWCRGTYTNGPINRWVEDAQKGEFTSFHAFDSTTNYAEASDGCCQCSNASACVDTYWWYKTPYYKCTYTDYSKIYKFKKNETKESETYPTGENITDIAEWVRYM